MAETLRVLTVCTHNQTRSVISAGLLRRHFREADLPARVLSVGISAGGGAPATDRAVRLLAGCGVDARQHRSTRITDAHIVHADLIVCAEHQQVVWIAGANPDAYRKCFTLPEIVRLGEQIGPRGRRSLDEWLDAVGAERASPIDYLELRGGEVGELGDPTGMAPSTWGLAFDEIDDLTGRLVRLVGTE